MTRPSTPPSLAGLADLVEREARPQAPAVMPGVNRRDFTQTREGWAYWNVSVPVGAWPAALASVASTVPTSA